MASAGQSSVVNQNQVRANLDEIVSMNQDIVEVTHEPIKVKTNVVTSKP